MRKKMIVPAISILLALSAFVISFFGQATAMADENVIQELTLTGSASISIAPDCAKISAEIQTLDMDKVKSKDDNFEIFENVLQALEENGIERDEVTLDCFYSYASYDYGNGKSLLGHYTTTDFSFSVKTLDEIKKYVDILTESGTTSIKNITYSASNYDEKYTEALQMAINNAKEKAKAIGGESLTLKEIKEESVYSSSTLYRTYSENAPQMIGEITISAKVVAVFE